MKLVNLWIFRLVELVTFEWICALVCLRMLHSDYLQLRRLSKEWKFSRNSHPTHTHMAHKFLIIKLFATAFCRPQESTSSAQKWHWVKASKIWLLCLKGASHDDDESERRWKKSHKSHSRCCCSERTMMAKWVRWYFNEDRDFLMAHTRFSNFIILLESHLPDEAITLHHSLSDNYDDDEDTVWCTFEGILKCLFSFSAHLHLSIDEWGRIEK